MRVVATFSVGPKQLHTLRTIIDQVAPQVHLQAPTIIQEFEDEQVLCQGSDEAGLGLGEQSDDQAPRDDNAGSLDVADGDGQLAGAAGQDAEQEPQRLDADGGAAGVVHSEEGGAVSPAQQD